MTGVGGFLGAPLLVGAVLFIVAFLSVIIGIIGIISDLIRTNRILIEDTLEHTKKMRFGKDAVMSEPVIAPAPEQMYG